MLEIPSAVQTLLTSDTARKNLRIITLDGSVGDMTNENIVQSSVCFTESLCSKSELKFGLCESSSLQFTTNFDKDLRGKEIKAVVEIDCTSLGTHDGEGGFIYPSYVINDGKLPYPYYRVPYGTFKVTSCLRDFKNGLRKVVAVTIAPWDDEASKTYGSFSWIGLGQGRHTFYPIKRWLGGLSPVENFKLNQGCTKVNYTFDIGCFVASNLPGGGLSLLTDVNQVNLVYYDGAVGGINGTVRNASGQAVAYFRPYIKYAQLPSSLQITEAYFNKLFYIDGVINDCLGYYVKFIEDEISKQTGLTKSLLNNYYNSSLVNYIFPNDIFGRPRYRSRVRDAYLCENSKLFYPYTTGKEKSTSQYDQEFNLHIPYGAKIEFYNSSGTLLRTAETCFFKDSNGADVVPKLYVGSSAFKGMGTVSVPRSVPYYDKRTQLKPNYFTVSQKAFASVFGFDAEFDMRQITEATYELEGGFAIYDRDSSAYGIVKLPKYKAGTLDPEQRLTPSGSLGPASEDEGVTPYNIYPQMIQQVWADDKATKLYGRVKIKCQPSDRATADGDDAEIYSYCNGCAEESFDSNSWLEYDLSENYLFKIFSYTEEMYQNFADKIASALEGIAYTPMKVTAHNLPFIEAGDPVELVTSYGRYDSYVLKQTIKGITNIVQTMQAGG